jgi:hypothetical protein
VVLDQKVILGENYIPTYSALAVNVSTNVNVSIFQLMAGSSLNVRVRRIVVTQDTLAGAATSIRVGCERLSSAGSGGTSTTPAPFIGTDGSCGATAMSGMTVGPSLVGFVVRGAIGLAAAHPMTTLNAWEWVADRMMESILIPAGTSNGLNIQISSLVASAAVTVEVTFCETSF